MKIAFFNWRDIKNPLAGGAEVYNHQILRRLAKKGHKISLFTSSFPGSAERESVDGIEHIRYGGKLSIYPRSFFCYKKYIEDKYDVIVEGINGVPFFTKLFSREMVVPLIYQLTRKNWYSGIPFPFAFVGYHAEDLLLGPYRRQPTLTISQSTKSDLEHLGFVNVKIIHAAADIIPPKKLFKRNEKTLIYLGRLTKSKRVDHVLFAFKIISQSIEDAHLWIVGSGPEEKYLVGLAKKLGISERTRFFGKVSQTKKSELLSKAHIMLFPAVREGWGLVVLEANACATPVVGYNVPGLRDSIRGGFNGYLVDDSNVKAMAERAVSLLQNEEALENISSKSMKYSKKFSWDKSSKEFASFLQSVVR